MVQKRQLAEEEYDATPKHLKLENSCQLVSCLEFPSKDVPLKPCNSGIAEARFTKETSENYCQFESGKITGRFLSAKKDVYYPPLKEIPIGPEYQADIPEWCGNDPKNASKTSIFCKNYKFHDNKFIGSCVIPMPETNQTVSNDHVVVGKGRTDCCCEEPGSLRCVQQHIKEARNNLRENIGQERFSALGFDTMGDDVASNWTEDDEQLFHEVVCSNPVSLGKNFWDHLAEMFPTRTNQEIVGYYFNVFVLQKRAEQNRFDPVNVDSDDDEWQCNDTSSDDADSYGFSIKNPILDHNDDTGFLHGFRGSINFTDPSDFKIWDVGYFSFPKKKTDFLPTCSMIEEVFGVESWNIK